MATSNFLAGVGASSYKPFVWLDILGIRHRFGSTVPSWSPADTGTNRAIKAYIKEVPQVSGQSCKPLDGDTDPASAGVKLIDASDEITELFSSADESDGITQLTVAVASGGVTLTVADSSVFSLPMDIYVERETMRATAAPSGTTLTVTRGMYGSDDVDHDITDAAGNSKQVLVMSRPPAMFTRECVLYMGFEGLDEADAIVLIRGFVDEGTGESQPGVWNIQIASHLKRLSCQIGETLGVTKLVKPLWGFMAPSRPPDTWYTKWCAIVESASDFADSGWVQIDEELIEYKCKGVGYRLGRNLLSLYFDEAADFAAISEMSTSEAYELRGRRRLGLDIYTPADNEYEELHAFHSEGAEVRQVISHVSFDNGSDDGVNPILAVLELLTSTGDGTNGSYDTLPAGWGAGIDESLIDVSGMEALAETFDYKIKFAINEATDLKDWLADNVFRPLLLFPVEKDDGTIGLERVLSESEAIDADSYLIDHSVMRRPPEYSPGKPPVGDIKLSVNYYPPQDKYIGTIRVILGDASQRYAGIARKLEAEVKTIYSNKIGRGQNTYLSGNMAGIHPVVAELIGTMWNRFGLNPCPEVRLEVPLSFLPYVKAGKILTLTCTATPDLKSSTRGITTEYIQVIEEGIDLAGGTCKPLCWMVGVHDDNYRMIAPSAKIIGYADPGPLGKPRLTLEPSLFTDGEVYTYDVDAFSVGNNIILLDCTSGAWYASLFGATPEVATIKTKGSGPGANDCYVDLNASPTTPPGVGDYIDTASYDDCVAAQKAAWSFEADANETLGAAEDDPVKRL